MSTRVTPLDPKSPKGIEIQRELSRVLASIRLEIEARERTKA